MKPNLKTPGGFVALPWDTEAASEPMTWEAYKAKYGVDLYAIFNTDDVLPAFRPEFRKLIYITQNHDTTTPPVVPVSCVYSVTDSGIAKLLLAGRFTYSGETGAQPSYTLNLYKSGGQMYILMNEI